MSTRSINSSSQAPSQDFQNMEIEEDDTTEVSSIEEVENVTWEKHIEHRIAFQNVKVIARSNGTIAYVTYNTITIWDWRTNEFEVFSLHGNEITALAELANGELIIGDELGRLYTKTLGWFSFTKREAIQKIFITNSSYCVIQFSDNTVFIIDIITGSKILDLKCCEQILLFQKNIFVCLDDENKMVQALVFDNAICQYKEKKYLFDEKYEYIIAISESTLLLLDEKKQIVTYNFQKEERTVYALTDFQNDNHDAFLTAIREDQVILLESGQFVYPSSKGSNIFLHFYSDGKDKRTTPAGNWQITAMKLLSHGFIIYGTDTRGSGIHVVTGEGDLIFSSQELVNEQRIQELMELPGGYVAMKSCGVIEGEGYRETISIIRPTNYHENALPLPQKCRKRLIVGDGDFTYTAALIRKHQYTHPMLPRSIIATELLNPVSKATQERVAALWQKGVEILFGIDAQQIHKIFKGQRFKRIHWNCPFGDPCLREQFRKVIPNFFRSCSKLQQLGDRVHVTLVQGKNDYSVSFRQRENPIVYGSVAVGYRLIRKRKFGVERYPGYRHIETGKDIKYSAGGEKKEFIFEKVEKAWKGIDSVNIRSEQELRDPNTKNYEIKRNGNSEDPRDYYFVCSSDEDSSDYFDSDDEISEE